MRHVFYYSERLQKRDEESGEDWAEATSSACDVSFSPPFALIAHRHNQVELANTPLATQFSSAPPSHIFYLFFLFYGFRYLRIELNKWIETRVCGIGRK